MCATRYPCHIKKIILLNYTFKKEIYIIRANGKVISQRQYSYSKFYNMELNRGDIIVIPSKIKVPVMWRFVLRDTTQILFQALSIVALVMSL